MRASWRLCVLVLLAYALLSLVLTWPVVGNLSTHVPGNGSDDPPLTWNLWWVAHALLDLGTNPLVTDYLFYPIGINLAFYTLTLLNGLLSVPLQATLGLIRASNLLLLSSFTLSGFGAFLLASYLLGRTDRMKAPEAAASRGCLRFAAFVAGLLYAFGSSKLFYAALGQWNIASSQWIPYYVLYLFRMGDRPGPLRYPVLAALFLLFQAYAELTYASFLVLFTLLWAAWHLLAASAPGDPAARGQRRWRLVAGLVTLALLFALGLSPILANMVPDLRSEGDIFAEGGGFADVFSADLVGFFVPTLLHPVLGKLVDRFHFEHTLGQHLYGGYAVLFLIGATILDRWRGHERRSLHFWLVSAFVWWLLTLGPTLRINGRDTGIPLPFALISDLPFLKGNRYPSRYSVLLLLSLAMLVALGLATILAWGRSPRAQQPRRPGTRYLAAQALSLVLAGVLVFEHLSFPLPMSDMRVPPVYPRIASALPADATLLDVPVAWRNGARVMGTLHPIIMFEQYYQTRHKLRVLAGNTSRNPPIKFQYFAEAPVISTLVALETGHTVDTEAVSRDRAVAPDVLRFLNIGGIVVHTEQAGPDTTRYLEEALPVEAFYQDEGTAAYLVRLPPWPRAWSIRPGQDLSRLSFAEGWSVPSAGVIWAQRAAVRLLVPLSGGEQRLTFSAYAPDEGQRLTVKVNGREAGSVDLTQGWADYSLALPAGLAREGLNQIRFHFAELYPAEALRLASRAVGTTGVQSPVNLTVQSAGLEVGDFGLIYVNGKQVSPNARGYNIVVLHPESGAVEQAASFDTHLGEDANLAMARFLSQIPAGHIVAVAAADEASRLLGQEAVDGLRGIGAVGDLRGKFRWAHAIVGVQGAPPGTAAETIGWMRPVSVVVGEGLTEGRAAAAFGTITFASSQ